MRTVLNCPKLALLLGCILLSSSLLQSCLWVEGDSRVFVTSDPAGADVLLDGKSTGKTTPTKLNLDGILGSDHTIRLQKIGYEPEDRVVTHYTAWNTSKWNDGAPDWSTFSFPLFWTFGDIVFPFEYRYAYVPHRLHIKLFEEGTFRRPGEAESTNRVGKR